MDNNFAKDFFPKQLSQSEQKRKNALNTPLTMKEIDILLSMRFSNKPIFESIESFYTEELRNALQNRVSPVDLDKIQRYRPATEMEANLLFSDIHARDRKVQYSSGGAPE